MFCLALKANERKGEKVAKRGAESTEQGNWLTADRLSVMRGGRLLLSGLGLSLSAGGAMVIKGPNGIGKSSLLRAIAGLLPIYSGKLDWQGDMALADGNSALDPHRPLSVALGFWARIDNGRGTAQGNVLAALDAMALADLADVPVHMLSTGQARRAALARLLVRNADIWLLDEPANGLDSDSVRRLGTAMAAHRACGGIVIAASHLPLPLDDPGFCDISRYAARVEA